MNKSTPYELIPPYKPSTSNKDKFFDMRDYAAQIWREENGFEDGAAIELIPRKHKKIKTRFLNNNYRR